MEHAHPPATKRSGRNGTKGQSKAKTQRIEPAPFALTGELRQRIEARYLELANPVEFDGIRTQIAAEFGVPKPAVRAAVREVRRRRGMPSWWELQGFSGSSADLERIKAAYMPYLPFPPVGIHREIAASLGLESRTVYRGIRKIRAQMGLPQYNALEEHPEQAAVTVMSGE
jgi:transposase